MFKRIFIQIGFIFTSVPSFQEGHIRFPKVPLDPFSIENIEVDIVISLA